MTSRILLAGTDPAIRDALRNVLEHAGHEVLQAEAGQAPPPLRHGKPIHLLVLDLDALPESSWRSLEGLTDFDPMLPVVLLTGLLEEPDAALGAPIGAVLEKPVDVPLLIHTLERLLAETRDERWERLAGSATNAPGRGSPTTRIIKELRTRTSGRIPVLPYRLALAERETP